MTHGSARMTARLLTAALLSSGLFGFSLPARAGFEFKPDTTAAAPATAPDMGMPAASAASPAASVDMTPLPGSPTVHSYPMGTGAVATPPGSDIASMPGGDSSMMQPPAAPSLNYGHAPAVTDDMVPPPAGANGNRQPMSLPPTSQLLPMDEARAAPQGAQSDYASIKGFGKDMPLALAMHEIVPTGYAYSFDGGVNPGLRVSWQGGRSWNEVLADALAPYGLRPVIGGQTVRILPAHAADMTASATKGMADDAEPPASPAKALTVSNGPMPSSPPPSASMQSASMPSASVSPAPMPPASFASSGFAPMPVSPAVPTPAANLAEPTQSYPHRVPHKHLNNWQPDATTPAPVSADAQDPGPPPFDQKTPAGMPAVAQAPAAMDHGSMGGQSDPTPPPIQTPPDAGQDAMMAPPPSQPDAPASPSFYTPPQTQPGQKVSAEDIEPMAGDPTAAFNPPPAGPAAVRFWSAERGQSLQTVLQQWCQEAGVQLMWSTSSDYKVPQSVGTSASFTDALRDMLSSYDSAAAHPKGALHTNAGGGEPVLVIENAKG
jgi:hypothetical protein